MANTQNEKSKRQQQTDGQNRTPQKDRDQPDKSDQRTDEGGDVQYVDRGGRVDRPEE